MDGGGQVVKQLIAALDDVISIAQKDTNRNKKATPTEYFAVLMSSLQGKTDYLCERLEILEAVIPQSNRQIVQTSFRTLSLTVLTILKQNNDNTKLLKGCFGTIGALVNTQDTSDGFWGGSHALHTVNILLMALDEKRSSLRKIASTSLCNILLTHKRASGRALRAYVADFCLEVMRNCSRSEYNRSLCIVRFLESSAGLFADPFQLLSQALLLQACDQPVLTAAVFRMIDSFYQSPDQVLSAEIQNELIKAVLHNAPSTKDMEANAFSLTALASGLVSLHKCSHELSAALLCPVLSRLVQACDSDFTQIHCACGTALKRIVSSCFDEYVIANAKLFEGEDGRGSILSDCVAVLEPMLQLRNQNSWLFVLDGIRSMYDQLRTHALGKYMDRLTVRLADVYQAAETQALVVLDPAIRNALGDAIGCALGAVGLVHFLKIIPLSFEDTPAFVGVDKSREWVLTILHTHLKRQRCALADFVSVVLGVARTCSQAMKSITDKPFQTALARRRILQMWALFPEFCECGAVDVPQTFPRLSGILKAAMQDVEYPELLSHVAAGLSHLLLRAREKCPAPRDSEEILVLKTAADTLLPLLLSVLEPMDISDERFQITVQCVGHFADVASPALLNGLLKRLLQLLLSTTMNIDVSSVQAGSAWMSVMLIVIPHLSEQMVTLLYRTIRPLLSISQPLALQKRAYLVLEALLLRHASVLEKLESKIQILAVISDSLLFAHVSARHMRLRCLEALISGMTAEDLAGVSGSVLGEVLVCQKDSNRKTRETAVDILARMVKQMEPAVIFPQLCSGVVGETFLMRSSSIIGLCVLVLAQRTDNWLLDQARELLPTLVLLLKEENSEQTRAVLAFIRVFVTVMSVDELNSHLELVLRAVLTDVGAHKTKFSSRIRAIVRKLSQRVTEESLAPFIPEADHALLAYIQKQARRSKRKKDSRDDEKLNDMLESEDEDDSDDGKAPVQPVRPKATRAKELLDESGLPRTIEDLLEDQPAAFRATPIPLPTVSGKDRSRDKGRSSDRATGDDSDDDDKDYRVRVAEDGMIVVEARPDKGAKPNPPAMSAAASEKHPKQAGKAPEAKKRQREPGEEYRSNKAGGDVWRRGMLAPHAYIPLDGRLLSKKNHDQAVKHFATVIKTGQGKTGKAVGRDRNGREKVSREDRGKRVRRSKSGGSDDEMDED